jgi:hypothetical protein
MQAARLDLAEVDQELCGRLVGTLDEVEDGVDELLVRELGGCVERGQIGSSESNCRPYIMGVSR